MSSSLQATGWRPSVADWGGGLFGLIGGGSLLAANRGSNCSLKRAMDGRIVRCGIISSCQSCTKRYNKYRTFTFTLRCIAVQNHHWHHHHRFTCQVIIIVSHTRLSGSSAASVSIFFSSCASAASRNFSACSAVTPCASSALHSAALISVRRAVSEQHPRHVYILNTHQSPHFKQ